MAQCAQCRTQETAMYENGVPICLACATDKAAKIRAVDRAIAYGTMDGISTLPKDLGQAGRSAEVLPDVAIKV